MLATQSDAHREWHQNSGVPMGLPGCPQDACHTDWMEPAEIRALTRQRDVNFALMRGEEGDATIRCAHCHGIHLAPKYVRECGAPAPERENDDADGDTDRYSQSDLDAMADAAADREERWMDR